MLRTTDDDKNPIESDPKKPRRVVNKKWQILGGRGERKRMLFNLNKTK